MGLQLVWFSLVSFESITTGYTRKTLKLKQVDTLNSSLFKKYYPVSSWEMNKSYQYLSRWMAWPKCFVNTVNLYWAQSIAVIWCQCSTSRPRRHQVSSSEFSVSSLSFDLKYVYMFFENLSWGLSWGIGKFGDGGTC